ncbi:MAG: serine/threonine-protein kinase [Acidobacteriota bacterium]
MTPELWRRVAGVMEVTLELDKALRQVYLSSIATQEPAVAQQVRSLLVSMDEIDDGDLEPTTPGSPGGHRDAERIGPYRIRGLLGQGGMGTVFLAEQVEEGLQRQVAIKLIHDRYAVTLARQRFLVERQILAHLEHPNIARMYDAGTTADGRPYLVIEYVEGLPLDHYCETHHLDLRERLELFRRVAQAVSYAHGHLVVHRDLKPSNILVTADGVPKLLDFGIAKILDRDLFGLEAEELTRTAEQPMTPSYASPEQVHGLPITVATDVFALGALLYKLLSGRTPFRYPSKTPEVMAAVQATDLAPPSEALRGASTDAPATLAGRANTLLGDLDNIALRALSREPGESYRSVVEFSEDIDRFLDGRPVEATRGSLIYRAKKFVGRHRWPVMLTTLLFASLALGLVITQKQAGEIRQQRDQIAEEKNRVEFEKARSDEVSEFLIEVFANASPDGKTPQDATIREVLEQATESVDESFKRQPLTKARLYQTLGNIYFSLGLPSEGRHLIAEALTLNREHLPPGDEATISSLIALARPLIHTGRFERAEEVLQEALSYTESLTPSKEVDILVRLAEFHRFQSQNTEAMGFMQRALAVAESGDDVSDETRTLVANSLSATYYSQGDYAEAIATGEKALEFSRRAHGDLHTTTAANLQNLAGFKTKAGAVDEARGLMEESLEIYQQLLGDSPKVNKSKMNLVIFLLRDGQFEEAVPLAREVVEGYGRFHGARSPNSARALYTLALALLKRGEPGEARELCERSIDIYREKRPTQRFRLIRPLQILGTAHRELGNLDRAIEAFRETVEIIEALPEDERRNSRRRLQATEALVGLARSHLAAGQNDVARTHFEAADLKSRAVEGDSWSPEVADFRLQTLIGLDRRDEAIAVADRLREEGFTSTDYREFCGEPSLQAWCELVSDLIPPTAPAAAEGSGV